MLDLLPRLLDALDPDVGARGCARRFLEALSAHLTLRGAALWLEDAEAPLATVGVPPPPADRSGLPSAGADAVEVERVESDGEGSVRVTLPLPSVGVLRYDASAPLDPQAPASSLAARYAPDAVRLAARQLATALRAAPHAPRRVPPESSSLAALLAALPHAAVVADAEHRVLAANDAFCALFLVGDEPGSLLGRPLEVAMQHAPALFAHPDAFQATAQALRATDAPPHAERLDLEDGRVVQLRVAPLRAAAHDLGQLWTFEDTTGAEEAAEAMRRAEALAAEATQLREQFLSNMSHEIRTPMNAIVGMAHLLGESELDAMQRDLVGGLRRSADHLLRLIEDVLDFSKLAAQRVTFAAEPFALDALLDRVAAPYRADADALAFDVAVEDDVPRSLLGDAGRLAQVLDNLLANAFKFTHEGQVALAVACERVQGGRAVLRFDVRDTGIGIDALQRGRIFDQFRQALGGMSRSRGGAGLGLAIVKEIVEQQGGTVALESEVGVGSTFSVRLSFPLDEGADPRQAPAASALPDLPDGELDGARVLVVDDYELNRLLVTQMLLHWSAASDEAEDGGQAVERVRAAHDAGTPYDLVLMDVQMPGVDGFEATRAIRALPSAAARVPIIALTASTGVAKRDAVFAAGMDDYVAKPFRPDHLLRRLQAHLAPSATVPEAPAPEGGAALRLPNADLDAAPADALPTPEEALDALDLSQLEAHALGDADFARHLLTTFLKQTTRLVDDVLQARDAGDWEAVRLLTHKLRPSLRMVGLDRLEALAQGLDAEAAALQAGQAPRPAPDFDARLEALVAAGRAVCRHLDAEHALLEGDGATEALEG